MTRALVSSTRISRCSLGKEGWGGGVQHIFSFVFLVLALSVYLCTRVSVTYKSEGASAQRLQRNQTNTVVGSIELDSILSGERTTWIGLDRVHTDGHTEVAKIAIGREWRLVSD